MKNRFIKRALCLFLTLLLCMTIFSLPVGAVISLPNGNSTVILPDDPDFTKIGESMGYDICFYYVGAEPMLENTIMGKYCFSTALFTPYFLGLFATNGSELYTLEQAWRLGLINIDEVAELFDKSCGSNNEYPYTCYVYRFGDADLNGTINVRDALLVQKSIAGIINVDADYTLSGLSGSYFMGDYNNDGTADVNDVLSIQKVVAGLES